MSESIFTLSSKPGLKHIHLKSQCPATLDYHTVPETRQSSLRMMYHTSRNTIHHLTISIAVHLMILDRKKGHSGNKPIF